MPTQTPPNLLKSTWKTIDLLSDLRELLEVRIGGPGQFSDRRQNPNMFYLPLGGASCKIALKFKDNKIAAIEPGEAFDQTEWNAISDEVDGWLLPTRPKIGRMICFSTDRVLGSWRGEHSNVQILPPPPAAPRADVERAEHPFILEFPINASDVDQVTGNRLKREYRRLTHLLNVLLSSRILPQLRQPEHFWARLPDNDIKWVQNVYYTNIGSNVIDTLSDPSSEKLVELDPQLYFTHDGFNGSGLQVPTNLDYLIQCYMRLSIDTQAKFDRSAFWMVTAARQWNISVSSSFASLVSATESLINRGDHHKFTCPVCSEDATHDYPGPTRLFREFFDTYAPGAALDKRRSQMYSLRSDILHGTSLMQVDQDLAFGWDPPGWNERELHLELWSVMRIALVNWLIKAADNTVKNT